MKNIFIDCEMTGLDKSGQLISIGALYVDNNGVERTFYAEFDDFDHDNCNDWIKDNVIAKLKFNEWEEPNARVISIPYSNEIQCIEMKSNSMIIGDELYRWIQNINERVIMVADVGHYDISMVFNLLGGAFNLPSNLSPAYLDLNNMIAISKSLNVDQAFDLSREKLAGEVDCEDKHNALYDAKVAKIIYDDLMKNN